MSLSSLLGLEYEPTGAFSFEFFLRDSITKKFIGEGNKIFFLLPPEEYSISEGYKVSVQKTLDGAWIDDFGNDLKKIKLSGSLYSFYKGFPATNVTGLMKMAESAVNTAKSAANAVVNTVSGGLLQVPGLGGLSGLDEFYKLRWLVSRFRDRYVEGFIPKESEVPLIPDTINEKMILTTVQGRKLFDKIGIVYHDYDDSNHFEVVFENFSIRRSKDDPFTAYYNIDMIAIREIVGSPLFGLGKVQTKDSLANILKNYNDMFNEILDSFRNILNIPLQLIKTFEDLYNSFVSLYDSFVSFTNNLASDFYIFTSKIKNFQLSFDDFNRNLFEVSTNQSFDELLNENIKYPEEHYDVIKLKSDSDYFTSYLSGTPKYFSDFEKEKTYDNVDNKVLDDSYFDNTQRTTDKGFTAKGDIYYIVEQNDTLQKLALKFYGDVSKAAIISDANDLDNRDFENDGMVGKNITIPIQTPVENNLLQNNLVYYTKNKNTTVQERKLQVLGNDIRLDSNREFVVDGNGDISMVYGEDCYLANILDRLSYKQGTLSPTHQEWGIPINIGEAFGRVALDVICNNINAQVSLDPRTQIGYVDKKNVSVYGDEVKIPVVLIPFTGNQSILDVGKALSVLFGG